MAGASIQCIAVPELYSLTIVSKGHSLIGSACLDVVIMTKKYYWRFITRPDYHTLYDGWHRFQ